MKFKILFLFIILSLSFSYSQTTTVEADDSDSTNTEEKSYFTSSVSYISNSVTAGRAESNAQNPEIGASVGYNFKFGMYLNAETGILPNQLSLSTTTSQTIFSGLSVQSGYGFTILEDILTADLNYTHYLFQNTSKISSEIKGTAAATLSFDLDFIGLDIASNYSYGNLNNDVLFTFTLNKNINLFRIGKDTLSLTPTLSALSLIHI